MADNQPPIYAALAFRSETGIPVTGYIDAHLHFWDSAVARYQWLDNEPRLPARFTLYDYRRATADDPPERFLFIEAGADPADSLKEARWVHAMCRTEPDFGGMVVQAPVGQGHDAVAMHLDALEISKVVGVRRLIQWEPLGFCTAPDFVGAVDSLGSRGLAFDMCIFPHQLEDALMLARSAPDTRLVLDHFGKPDIARGGIASWQRGLEALAALDHVWCKLSGLVTEADHLRWKVGDLRPFVHTALEVFGSHRLLWGSDWPICTVASTHQRWREATYELLGDLSAGERGQLLAENARTVYRLK